MSNLLDTFSRVTPDCPCPVCGKGDWCLVKHDGTACICTRVAKGRKGKAGWYHYLGKGAVKKPPLAKKKVYLSHREVEDAFASVKYDYNMLDRHARALKLSPDALVTMQAKAEAENKTIIFPMFNARRRITGYRIRFLNGDKRSLKGGREGVFLSESIRSDKPMFIAEGPTDSAALVHIGFRNVMGRPNCDGGADIICHIMSRWRTTPVVIVADPDKPGLEGGRKLAELLPNPTVVIAGKQDIRDFVSSGLLQSDCRLAIIEGVGRVQQTEHFATHFRNNAGLHYDFSTRVY